MVNTIETRGGGGATKKSFRGETLMDKWSFFLMKG